MAAYKYDPIDLEGHTFRLVRLRRGDSVIQCDLIHAWLDDTDMLMEYEALSYTWGGSNKARDIELDGVDFPITANLFLALRYLRHTDQDRILWIDAICIDQHNNKERGHQVGLMTSIYRRADRVRIWLGEENLKTNFLLRSLNALEEDSRRYACNRWQVADKRWQDLWSNTQTLLGDPSGDRTVRQCEGLNDLLSRPWFKRVWILQEVASARSAEVVCGRSSVSARVFAIAPLLLDLIPDAHCQAVLDIFPGQTRVDSWWSESRDLRTLLLKFQACEASDKRDNVYALLGIATDTCDTKSLEPDYQRHLSQLIKDVVLFIHPTHAWETGGPPRLPLWMMRGLSQRPEAVERLATDCNSRLTVQGISNTDEATISAKPQHDETLLLWAVHYDFPEFVNRLLVKEDINLDCTDLTRQTPLQIALRHRHEKIVELLLKTDKLELNSYGEYGDTLLPFAVAAGHKEIVSSILGTGKADVNIMDGKGRTPLSLAAAAGHKEIVSMLLDTGRADIDIMDYRGQTPLDNATGANGRAIRRLLRSHGEK